MIDLTPDFVLQVQDEFTGGSVDQRGILFQIGGRPAKSPLRKPGDFYVFQNMDGTVHDILIQCPYYYPRTIRVEQDLLDPAYPVIRVRLHRTSNGIFRDCERLEGLYRPGARVYALVKEPAPLLLQSVEETEEKTRLLTQGYTTRRLLARRFFVGGDKNGETLVIDENSEKGEYRTRDRLEKKHKPGEPLVRAYRSQCDDKGFYSIPVEPGDEQRIEKIMHYDGEKKKWDLVCVVAPS